MARVRLQGATAIDITAVASTVDAPERRGARSGAPLRGVFTGPGDAFEQLGHLWQKDVVMAGMVKFRPSGRVLRIEAEDIRAARGGEVAALSRPPQPLLPALDERALHVPQGPRSGVSALFGQWPGDEAEEAIEQALRTLS